MSKPCTVYTEASSVKVEEKKAKAVFLNPNSKKYSVTEIDGCLIKDGARCDFLVCEIGSASVFVELKGSKIEKACDQLLATIDREEVKPFLEKKIGFLVVASQSKPSCKTTIQKRAQKFSTKYKAGFRVSTSVHKFDIHEVVKIKSVSRLKK
jgi:hypothetical protein